MSRSICWTLLIVSSLAFAMPRNPFNPWITPCEALIIRLEQWALRGVVSTASAATAIMQDPQKRWRRIMMNMKTELDASVTAIDRQGVTVRLPAACKPALFTWHIEGVIYDMDATIDSAAGMAIDGSRR